MTDAVSREDFGDGSTSMVGRVVGASGKEALLFLFCVGNGSAEVQYAFLFPLRRNDELPATVICLALCAITRSAIA